MARPAVVLAIAALVATLGCAHAQQNQTATNTTTSANGTFAAAVTKLGLSQLASLATSVNYSVPATFEGVVFGPTNAAIDEVVKGAGLPPSYSVPQILQYHIVPGSLLNDDANDTDILATLLTGYNVNVLGDESKYYVYSRVDAAATFTVAEDCVLFNGEKAALCAIDKVLIPTNDTIASYVAKQADLSILYSLVANDTDLLSVATDVDTVATVFAPTNAAIEAFLKEANISATDPGFAKAVKATVLGHIVQTTTVPFSSKSPESKLTTLAGTNLTASAKGIVSSADANKTAVGIVKADGVAGKSYVHIIDAVLAVPANATIPVLPPKNGTNTTNGTVPRAPAPPSPSTAPRASGATSNAAFSGLAVLLAVAALLM